MSQTAKIIPIRPGVTPYIKKRRGRPAWDEGKIPMFVTWDEHNLFTKALFVFAKDKEKADIIKDFIGRYAGQVARQIGQIGLNW